MLAGEPDQSVIIIQVGFSTNLVRLLDSAGDAASPLGGLELVKKKVRLLSAMAGAFPNGEREYNIYSDLASAKRLFAEWPTPIVASGFEIGKGILYPAKSIEEHFRYVADHPVADAYRNYQKMPYDRPTWDLTSVLYAVRPTEKYFDLSPPGKIIVGDDSKTRLEPAAKGLHRYLTASEAQRLRVLEALIYLSSEPPMNHAPRAAGESKSGPSR
jgi:inosine-uridine nucleoside N-ribohydrolase